MPDAGKRAAQGPAAGTSSKAGKTTDKSTALTPEEANKLDIVTVRAVLSGFANGGPGPLAYLLDSSEESEQEDSQDDWDFGYGCTALRRHDRDSEEDSVPEDVNAIADWFGALEPLLQTVVDVGIAQAKGFQECHQVLCAICDSMANMNCADPEDDPLFDSALTLTLGPMRGPRLQMMMDGFADGDIPPVMAACGFVWRYLLRAAAASDATADADVLRMAATARRYKVPLFTGWEHQELAVGETFSFPGMPPKEPFDRLIESHNAARKVAQARAASTKPTPAKAKSDKAAANTAVRPAARRPAQKLPTH